MVICEQTFTRICCLSGNFSGGPCPPPPDPTTPLYCANALPPSYQRRTKGVLPKKYAVAVWLCFSFSTRYLINESIGNSFLTALTSSSSCFSTIFFFGFGLGFLMFLFILFLLLFFSLSFSRSVCLLTSWKRETLRFVKWVLVKRTQTF